MTRTDRLAEAQDRLGAAVEHLTNGEDWQRFLDTARRFRTYSLNNLLLIFVQRPDATRVAGYRTWQPSADRRDAASKASPSSPLHLRRADDYSDESESPARFLRGFKVVHVFDLEQTDGDPLPAPPVHLLDGDAPHGITPQATPQQCAPPASASPPAPVASSTPSASRTAPIGRHDRPPLDRASPALLRDSTKESIQ